ncbi:hypothetical protein Moror_9310 [Moniliophthora roreri MCA 2997]|uniref:Uncharacterized protein n=2 Tax=Moniliophthora roreri TaxID=221103 RepID=V2X130_MONRO|nr:hypothetical protein Moror_9310 [Moniliophthora roreri MCA 2997]KAI3605519.1 hypothetical protein WG66_005960 [Moniliophthora roreri]
MANKAPSDRSIPSEPPPLYEASVSSNALSSSSFTPPSRGGQHNPLIPQRWQKILRTFFLTSTSREVRRIVLRLIGDIVRGYNSSGFDAKTAKTVLQNCAQACERQGIPFSSLFQDWHIAGHTPIYWAIVNKPRRGSTSTSLVQDSESLLTTILNFAGPLKSRTAEEVRRACLIVSDDTLFQRLRISRGFTRLSDTDRMLLGGSVPDKVQVLDVVSQDGKVFVVDLQVMQFQKRMKISKDISVEFIAKNRMWRLHFLISDLELVDRTTREPVRGVWYVRLSLLQGSAPTYIDSRLFIIHNSVNCPPPGDQSLLDVYSDASIPPAAAFSKFIYKRIPRGQTQAVSYCLRIKSDREVKAPEPGQRVEDAITGSSWMSILQYTGSEYIGFDDSLRARLEAKLDKPEDECVIC